MSIRTKTITAYYYTYHSFYGTASYSYESTVPIRDWSANPPVISPPNWTIGNANPSDINLFIQFPELEFIYTDYTSFRFKIKKVIPGVDFISISAPGLTGNTFDNLNLIDKNLTISFQNLSNLSVGVHQIDIMIEAYGIDGLGNEVFVEDSGIQNIIIPVKLTVLSGTSFNTDKNTYNVIFNKADNSISGDSRVVVYSDADVIASSADSWLQTTQTSGASERYLNFISNTSLQALVVGNFSSSLVITRDTTSKTVTVNFQIINDATQFYVSPQNLSISLQKSLAENKTYNIQISNPNNLSILVDLKPDFIDSAIINGNVLTITTKNSSLLALGNYSGSIILKAGAVEKSVAINLSVIELITHDFKSDPYFFALDKNKIEIKKTNTASSRVKMVLDMYFQGFGEQFQESQSYTFPFFKGSVVIYPGEEIQDFFIKAIDYVRTSNPQYQYHLAVVNMKFYELSDTDAIVSTFNLDNILFAPGKKPKCFPIFTDFAIRSTYSNSLINLSVDKLSEKDVIVDFYDQYQTAKPNFVQSATVECYQLQRNQFKIALKKSAIISQNIKLIPIPDVGEIVHIEWENQNLVSDWFSAVLKVKETTEFENFIGESNRYKEEKFDSSYSKPITVNSGWILEEEIDLISDLLRSRICILHYNNKKVKVFPIGKKNEMKDSENNKFSMDLEFKILIEK